MADSPARLVYEVDPAGFDDWHVLHEMLVDCFAFMEDRIDPPSSLNRMTPDTLCQKAAAETLVLVRSDGLIVACGFLKVEDSAVYLGKLAVLESFRGQGILRRIVEIAEAVARNNGKGLLRLQTRVELTENQMKFEAIGFTKTAESSHPGFERPTSIEMTRFIQRPNGVGPTACRSSEHR